MHSPESTVFTRGLPIGDRSNVGRSWPHGSLPVKWMSEGRPRRCYLPIGSWMLRAGLEALASCIGGEITEIGPQGPSKSSFFPCLGESLIQIGFLTSQLMLLLTATTALWASEHANLTEPILVTEKRFIRSWVSEVVVYSETQHQRLPANDWVRHDLGYPASV